MKKFTVITKDGSKWMRPVNPFDNNDPRFTSKEPFCILGMRPCSKTVCECDEWKKFEKNNPTLPYIGFHPDGTVLSEEEVREVWQSKHGSVWSTISEDHFVAIKALGIKTRIAYTDDEPQCPECGKYCSCPEEDLYDAVADYRINHPEESHDRQVSEDYWRKRCESAERYINESPCDPDITKAQWVAYEAWQEIVNQQPKK